MKVDKGYSVWELRTKVGRRHLVVYRGYFRDDTPWKVRWPSGHGPVGMMRWYRRQRGKRWEGIGPWLPWR